MEKIKRDTFLYFSSKQGDFAQCGSCALMTYGHICAVFNEKVNLNDSCCAYIPGARSSMEPKRYLSKKEVGFRAKTQVRCENCYFGGAECGLYKELNKNGEYFALEPKIEPYACCNAWTPKEEAA